MKCRKKWLYIIVLIVIVIISIFLLNDRQSDVLQVHPIVINFLEEIEIEKSHINTIDGYDDVLYEISVPTVVEAEVNNYIETIKSNYGVDTITEDFVKEQFNFNSLDAFHQSIYSKLLEQKKVAAVINARKIIMEQLIDKCEFTLDKEEISNYSLEIVNSYETEAALHNMSIEEYCEKNLQISYNDFFDKCYSEGEYLVKSYLVIGVIGELELKTILVDENITSEQTIYTNYQMIENEVYKLFFRTEENF